MCQLFVTVALNVSQVERRAAERAEIMDEMKRHQKQVCVGEMRQRNIEGV